MSESDDDNRIDDSAAVTDFSHEALAHLRVHCDDFALHVRAFIKSPGKQQRRQLSDDLQRFRNTLVLLEKGAAIFVAEELLSLLRADDEARLTGRAEMARVLVLAADRLSEHVALLQRDDTVHSALPMLPLVNDSRACRGESLLSDVLLLAAGIGIPQVQVSVEQDKRAGNVAVNEAEDTWFQQRQAWSDHASARHGALTLRLLDWWAEPRDAVTAHAALVAISAELDALAAYCQSRHYLHSLTPLFQSASMVALAIDSGELIDGPALRSLYAQLERHLYRSSQTVAPEDLLPADLLRNFLYYAAQIESEWDTLSELRRRFRLERVRQVARANDNQATPTIGVVYHLARAISKSLSAETDSLRSWLDQPDDQDLQNAVDQRTRLIRLRVRLAQLEPVLALMGLPDALACLQRINVQLLDVEAVRSRAVRSRLAESLLLLDALLNQAARQSVRRSSSVAPSTTLQGEHVFVDMAIDACLREARISLQQIADSLGEMLATGTLATGRCHEITLRLQQVDQVLQILPLPEVTLLLRGLGDLLTRLQLHGRQTSTEASDADNLLGAMRKDISGLLGSIDEYLGCVLQPQASASQLLVDAEEALLQARALLGESSASHGEEFAPAMDVERQVARVLPRREAIEVHDAASLTLNVDDDLLADLSVSHADEAVDDALKQVFYHECIEHLDALENAVKSALQPSDGISLRLPTEPMLRALHTLAVSAHAIDATPIIAIVQPLQRAALTRQREELSFNAEETRFIGELLVALRARLENLVSGMPVSQGTEAVEQRLGDFLATIIPGSDAPDSGLGLASNVRSLDDIFREEAGELLDRLRSIVKAVVYGPDERRAALSILHTLKGSARMAGRVQIADDAHTLESELQAFERGEVDAVSKFGSPAAALKAGHATLSGLLGQVTTHSGDSQSAARHPVMQAGSHPADSLLVSDSVFDGLLDLATEVTVDQARLSEELTRLREVYHDIETTSIRWRALPQSEHLVNSAAVTEMLADVEAAGLVMHDAVHRAVRLQQKASRAAAALQQSLIRSRLVRVDEFGGRLSQAVQDAAESTQRQATLEVIGGELTLDRALYRKLLAPMEHVVRNAVVHGIETLEDRLANGKPVTGQVRLTASVDGTDLLLDIDDDGCGIDRQALNDLLRERGEPIAETLEDLQAVLFRSGFTSVQSPTALAGHGLGLSAVKETMEQIGGRAQLSTQVGIGTRISLRIPQRIVVKQVVLVECDGSLYGIPVSHVEAVKMAGVADKTGDEPVSHRRRSLAHVLTGLSLSDSQDSVGISTRAAVLVKAADQQAALEIDQVVGYRELVTQALGPQLASLRRYAGGSVLSDGRQVLIVDLNTVLDSPDQESSQQWRPARESLRPVALVVDDSFTMRAAAFSLLQQCGIAVNQSRDGVEALERLASALPDFIILDSEMPRLDGAGFLKRLRELYADNAPPVIVISSRDDAVNRDRMRKLGAVHFLAKPYTEDQLHLAIKATGIRLPDITIA